MACILGRWVEQAIGVFISGNIHTSTLLYNIAPKVQSHGLYLPLASHIQCFKHMSLYITVLQLLRMYCKCIGISSIHLLYTTEYNTQLHSPFIPICISSASTCTPNATAYGYIHLQVINSIYSLSLCQPPIPPG